jgi:PKD repeat protein
VFCHDADIQAVVTANDAGGAGADDHASRGRARKENPVNLRPKRLLPLAVAALVLAAPAIANAAPPANDAFATALTVDPALLPFDAVVPIDEATVEGGEPVGCYGVQKSVWYRITPSSSGTLEADVDPSLPDRVINVYRQGGSGIGGLSLLACIGPYTEITTAFEVTAGVTYYIQAGGNSPFGTGTLAFSLRSVPPPSNDDFTAAESIATVPHHATVDLTAATVENGEQTPSCAGGASGSAWYAFTPATTGSYTLGSANPFTILAAYTGGALASLQQVGCQNGSSLTFHADAGTTTYLRVSSNGFPGLPPGVSIQLILEMTPAPVAQFVFDPPAPSVFDTVSFFSQTYDPAGIGVQSLTWDYGDGATATGGCCVASHRYAADGTYHVTLTVVTLDGRTDDVTQDLVVKTHDVAITDVAVPDSIKVGTTKAVTVGISNGRYPETVRVSLLVSVAGGSWQLVGELTQYVPVKKGRRTVDFSFNYTATPDDAVLGKITFQAVAIVQAGPDAIPADNTYISLPVKVRS